VGVVEDIGSSILCPPFSPSYPTFIVAAIVFVVVSIIEILLLPPFVIYAYCPSKKEFCADKEIIKNKKMAVEAKIIIYDF
jgi:hypothetical protein